MAPADAERRLVTVLYADIAGHTGLITRMDPEDWRAVLQRYFAVVAKPIQRYGGTVEKYIGDAVFAAFGVPRAHEDDAVRAVRAATEMQEALARQNPEFARELGAPLALRIGIATGEAVAPGEAGGDQLIVGDLTALAERLQGIAPAGGIVLSERTYALVARLVEGEHLGPLTLKGFPEMQRAVLVRRVLTAAAGGLTAPLVDREDELANLLETGRRVRAGQGEIVCLIGDAGLGKSRLAAELRDRSDPATQFLIGRCHEFTQNIGHGLIVQLVRAQLGIGEFDPIESAREKLGRGLQGLASGALSEERPALEHLLGLEGTRADGGPHGLGPAEMRAELLRALGVFWERAAQSPLVLLVEDLHWADPASVEVLGRLCPVVERAPLMLLCTFRPERHSPAWEFRVAAEREYPHRYREIRLAPLSPTQTEELAAVLLQQLTLPVHLKDSVARRAEGNPFYVEEVVRSLAQPGGGGVVRQVPDTLQGVLQARFGALPPQTRRVLQAASVIGRSFPLRLLQVVADADGDLVAHLRELQRADFLQEVQRLPEPSFVFKHGLLREAAYQTLLRRERRELHRRLAEVLEGEAPGAVPLALLLHHLRQAEVWGKAFHCAVRAGDAALSLGAMREALEHYDTGRAIAAERPAAVDDPALLFHARLARAEALVFLGRYEEAETDLRVQLRESRLPQLQAQVHRGLGRLGRLQGDLGKARRHLERALHLLPADGAPGERAAALRDLAHVLEMKRDYPRALECARQALAIAEGHGLRAQVREARRMLFSIHLYVGDPSQAQRDAEATLAQALQEGDHLSISRSRIDLANVLLFTGDAAGARAQALAAVEESARLELDVPLVLAQATLAQIDMEQGRVEEAATIIAEVQNLVQRRALGPRWRAAALRGLGALSIARRDWTTALAQLEEARAVDERAGIARYLPWVHRQMAEAYLGLGDIKQARTHALAVKRLERGSGLIETPAALRVLGVVARERGARQRSAALLAQSRALLEARRRSGEYASTLIELARTKALMGRREEARRLVRESLAIYRRLDAPSLAAAAEDLAAAL